MTTAAEPVRLKRVLEGKGVAYAAERLGCSKDNVYRLVESGELPYVDVGAVVRTETRRRPTLRFLDEDLDAFIARRRHPRRTETPAAVSASNTPRPVIVRRGRFS